MEIYRSYLVYDIVTVLDTLLHWHVAFNPIRFTNKVMCFIFFACNTDQYLSLQGYRGPMAR
jgi:hypothetical protein